MPVELGLFARFLRWLSDLLWPGDYDRDVAKAAFTAYKSPKDAKALNNALEHFQLAVDKYRAHRNSALATTLANYALAVRKHYDDFGQSPADLDKVIDLDTDAQRSWSDEKQTSSYLVILSTLARAYLEQYQKSIGNPPVRPEKAQAAFDSAVKCFTELKNHPAAGSKRSDAQIQLGVMFRMRCERETKLDWFELGVQELQEALREATATGEDSDANGEDDAAKTNRDTVRAICLLNLAESYEVRYGFTKNARKTHELSMAIDYNAKAQPLLESLRHHELPGCQFNLARQLRLRWLQNQEESDRTLAIAMAEAASRQEHIDETLEADIEDLLTLLRDPQSRQGTLDSVDMGGPPRRSDSILVPRRQGTVASMDGQ